MLYIPQRTNVKENNLSTSQKSYNNMIDFDSNRTNFMKWFIISFESPWTPGTSRILYPPKIYSLICYNSVLYG